MSTKIDRPPSWNGMPIPYDATLVELESLVTGDGPGRWPAFVALAHNPSREALAILARASRSADADVRRAAVEALMYHPGASEHSALICDALQDTSSRVMRAACLAVAELGIRAAHASLLVLLKDREAATRQAALRGLRGVWQAEDFEAVFHLFRTDRADAVRKEAGWTLRQSADSLTWRWLFESWQTDSLHRHRAWACELAMRLGDESVVGNLERLTRDEDGIVRRKARAALAALDGV